MHGVSGGAGAPIKSDTGRLLVPLHDDPSIAFNDTNRSFVDKDLRYRRTPMEQTRYRQDLDMMVQEKNYRKKHDDIHGGIGSEYQNVSVMNCVLIE